MTQTTGTDSTETPIDRYIRIFDRSAYDPAALDELESIFAPGATVQLHDNQQPITGFDAIMKVYRAIAANMADSKHFWTTKVLDDGRIECRWVQAGRSTDGRLVAQGGIEHAIVDVDGLITDLRNRMVEPGTWA